MKRNIKSFIIFIVCMSLISVTFLQEVTATITQGSINIALIDSGISPIVIARTSIGRGKNYVAQDKDTADLIGHGTAIAGLILDNTPSSVLIPLVYTSIDSKNQVLKTDIETLAQIIYDAIDIYGCRLIVLSSGVVSDDKSLRDAVNYAEAKGVVIVASVGNDNKVNPLSKFYPASYSTVIGVGAIREDGDVASFSQRSGVNVVARGDNIKVKSLDGTLKTVFGTSYSAGTVAGIVANLIISHSQKTPLEIRELLYSSATDVCEVGFDESSGYGVVGGNVKVKVKVKKAIGISLRNPIHIRYYYYKRGFLVS